MHTRDDSSNPHVLQVRGVHKRFGSLCVAENLSLSLARGARHALIGPNGAGKTTFVNLITGILKPDAGQIFLNNEDVSTLPAHVRAKRGLARTFQINELFRTLSTLDNVCLAIAEREGLGYSMIKPFSRHRPLIDEAMSTLQRFGLEDDALKPISELAYGRQRLVEIVIAMSQRPQVLILDEPAAGVPSEETEYILSAIDQLEDDTAILIIEHDMDVVFRFAKEITVLASGAIISQGSPDAIANDQHVKDIYLGHRSA